MKSPGEYGSPIPEVATNQIEMEQQDRITKAVEGLEAMAFELGLKQSPKLRALYGEASADPDTALKNIQAWDMEAASLLDGSTRQEIITMGQDPDTGELQLAIMLAQVALLCTVGLEEQADDAYYDFKTLARQMGREDLRNRADALWD